jgi:hypothetical protein
MSLTLQVHAGLVFTAATDPFLEATGGMVESNASLRLVQLATEGEMEVPGQQVVVLSTLLSHPVNIGYEEEDYEGLVLSKVNDVKINNMVDAAKAIRACTGQWIVFEFEGSMTVVLPREESIKATSEILRQQSIPAPMSADLLEAVGDKVPDAMTPADAVFAPSTTAAPAKAVMCSPAAVDGPAACGPPEGKGGKKHHRSSAGSAEGPPRKTSAAE